ncbi:MAG TPA: GNAT family N-acetyltransferase [Pseudonocardia sp.]|jgi:hypothetical protein
MALPHAAHPALVAEGAAARPAWEELVAGSGGVALAKTPQWFDCVRDSGRFADATLLFAGADGRPLVLPRLRRTGPVPGLFEAPPPGWGLGADAGGLVAVADQASPGELAAVVEQLVRHPGLRTRVMVGGAEAAAWASAVPRQVPCSVRAARVLDLDGGFGEVWARRFTGKVRSQSRKAERRSVVVESDSTGRLVPVFDRLYRRSVDRWARQGGRPSAMMRWRAGRADPRDKFAAVAARLGPRCTVWIAWHEGEPVAGIIVLARGERAIYWRGAMDERRARGTGANELLHRSAIEAECARGRRSYDFGLSQSDSLTRFKGGFGAHDVPVRVYHFERLPLSATEARARAAARRAVLAATAVGRTGRR